MRGLCVALRIAWGLLSAACFVVWAAAMFKAFEWATPTACVLLVLCALVAGLEADVIELRMNERPDSEGR